MRKPQQSFQYVTQKDKHIHQNNKKISYTNKLGVTYRPTGLLCTPARDTESGQSLNAFTCRTQNHNFLL